MPTDVQDEGEKLAAMVTSLLAEMPSTLTRAQAAALILAAYTKAEQEFSSKISRLHTLLWNAGVCPVCEEEISHHIEEPFADCKCGGGEATTIPTIAKLRHEKHCLIASLEGAKNVIKQYSTLAVWDSPIISARGRNVHEMGMAVLEIIQSVERLCGLPEEQRAESVLPAVGTVTQKGTDEPAG